MKIRARKKAEEELSRVNRELRAITECGKAIVKATDEQTLLNVCRRLVEAHSGRIWVESESSRGATFYFSLPLSSD